MTIEFLYPEIANLFGEIGHQQFLELLFPTARFIRTQLLQKPAFLDQPVDLVYMGPSSEQSQEKIIRALIPHRDAFVESIERGGHFLFTGNALEVLGTSILTDEGELIEALDIFSMQARRQMMKRLTDLYIGLYEEIKVVGFKTQFTQNYPKEPENFPYLFRTLKGFGMHKGLPGEGVHYQNFIGTYLVGPLLIFNPLFTERLFEGWGIPIEVPHRKTLLEAYNIRLEGFEDPKSYA